MATAKKAPVKTTTTSAVGAKKKTTKKKVTTKKTDTVVTRVNDKGMYTGEIPTSKLVKTNEEVRKDAIKWAKWIAGDNSFHYGYTNKKKGINAHHNGCYFCGTNTDKGGRSKKGIKDFEKTYCCNPFVHAAWAHGGCIPQALKICRAGSSWGFLKSEGYYKSSLFDNIKKPAKTKLKFGDVLCKDNHAALYIGGGKIAEASGGDDNKKGSKKWNDSIHVIKLTDDYYKKFKRVHRYNGSVNVNSSIYYGEVSERVKRLQEFLKWFGYNVKVTGLYDGTTLTAVKSFQKAVGVKPDSIVGPNTFNKIKEYKKAA